jgi:hypothetical protein
VQSRPLELTAAHRRLGSVTPLELADLEQLALVSNRAAGVGVEEDLDAVDRRPLAKRAVVARDLDDIAAEVGAAATLAANRSRASERPSPRSSDSYRLSANASHPRQGRPWDSRFAGPLPAAASFGFGESPPPQAAWADQSTTGHETRHIESGRLVAEPPACNLGVLEGFSRCRRSCLGWRRS